MKRFFKAGIIIAVFAALTTNVFAHCQVPCGIYGDMTRVVLLKEHLTTIEKSMNQINELSASPQTNMNQLVRWVNNKETHADEFSEIVTYYFLAQRVKIAEESDSEAYAKYQKQAVLLHQMVVFAMKCKQTTDVKNVEKLRSLIDQFNDTYFSDEDKQHLKDHHN